MVKMEHGVDIVDACAVVLPCEFHVRCSACLEVWCWGDVRCARYTVCQSALQCVFKCVL